MTGTSYTTPHSAWAALTAGNQRFVDTQYEHPNVDVGRRQILKEQGQFPHVAVLSCSDSRVPVEIVFDQGLGDMFVVRNAGHVPGLSILASLELAVESLRVPLIVVMGHQYCEAIRTTEACMRTERELVGFQAAIVDKVSASVRGSRRAGGSTLDDYERYHVRHTVEQIVTRSQQIRQRIARGELGVVGTHYDLQSARVVPLLSYGVDIEGVELKAL